MIERALERHDPLAPWNVWRQRRYAIGCAIEHVELVGNLVHNHVEAVPRLFEVQLHIGKRQHEWTALPGLADQHVVAFGDDAATVVVVTAAHLELAGIHQDLAPPAEHMRTLPQRRQAGLHGDQQLQRWRQLRAGQRMKALAGEEHGSELA
jgi:hypothetical protein